jgi:hypothetical protein
MPIDELMALRAVLQKRIRLDGLGQIGLAWGTLVSAPGSFSVRIQPRVSLSTAYRIQSIFTPVRTDSRYEDAQRGGEKCADK